MGDDKSACASDESIQREDNLPPTVSADEMKLDPREPKDKEVRGKLYTRTTQLQEKADTSQCEHS